MINLQHVTKTCGTFSTNEKQYFETFPFKSLDILKIQHVTYYKSKFLPFINSSSLFIKSYGKSIFMKYHCLSKGVI